MEGNIGVLNWLSCETCKHYRPEEGGCLPIDGKIVELQFDDYGGNDVICSEYNRKWGEARKKKGGGE